MFNSFDVSTRKKQHPVSQSQRLSIENEIRELLCKRAIEEVQSETTDEPYGFHSTLFTIPKKTGGDRPVLNLKPLNKFIPRKPFKMETMKTICQLLKKGYYMTSVDLTDAFLHVLLHQASKKYLRFCWDHKVYQFRTIAFGMSLSPMVFTKILRPVLKWARRQGILTSGYLDDLLVIGKSAAITHLHTSKLIKKLQALGFLINQAKSHLTPTNSIQHLGFIIDTTNMTLTVPSSKIRDIRRCAQRLLHRSSATLTALQSFVGKALATSMAVFPARLNTRNLLTTINHWRRCDMEKGVLNSMDRDNLHWWIQHLQQWNGHSFIPEKATVEVFTDASNKGWGIVEGNNVISGQWDIHDRDLHINILELKVLWYVVTNPRYQGQAIQVYCDNNTVVAYINHFGGTRSQTLLQLSQQIWEHCLQSNTRLKVQYIATMFNPADLPSRQQLDHQLEWSLCPRFFQTHLNQPWGPHQIDLFASALNKKIPTYVSWKMDPLAFATNAFSISWTPLHNPYICPPWNLIPQVLQKLQLDQVKQCTLITPNWPSAIWYSLLQQQSVHPPVVIPRTSVLAAPGQSQSILEKNRQWQLIAWHLAPLN